MLASETPPDGLPRYRDLNRAGDLPARVAWNVFGPDDRIGTLSLLSPERVRHAAGLVRKGSVFPLNWRLELPDPPILGRRPMRHTVNVYAHGMDDFYDQFYPQASSQWDALSHIGHPDLGYFGGHTASDVGDPKTNPLGIERWARRGIAGRFVLIDVGRHREAQGEPLNFETATAIGVDELTAILAEQGTRLLGGDILLVRFGWLGWYEAASAETRREIARQLANPPIPGLAQDEAMAEWLWDQRVAAIAADNPGVERYPADPTDLDHFLHYRLIPFLGMAIGELFALDHLAADCAADGVYEGLFTASPLNKQGGCGSTANAIALK